VADPVQTYVDPLPQAMVLTAIVIGLATTAMLMAVIIRFTGNTEHLTFVR
jgi:multisubunit Na+/H+ antiporter MnhC subunit